MTFFYDLNKRLAALSAKSEQEQIAESTKAEAIAKSPLTQALNESAMAEAGYSAKAGRAGKDLGKPGKNFAKIAKSAGARYGSQAAGERVAGAVLNKLRHPTNEGICSSCGCSPCECVEESALQGYLGKKKYGPEGMKALQKAGRDHVGKAKMDQIRNRYDKMDEADMEEGNTFSGALANAKKDHKSEFEVDGKKYKVVEADQETDEGAGVMHFKDQKAKEAGKKSFKLGDKTFPVKEKKEPRSKGTAFDPETAKGMFADKDEHPRHDVKDTGYSKRYTRKHEDDIEKDDEVKSDEPKRKGRPKSAKPKDQENVTKGSYKYKMVNGKRVLKDKVKEDGIPLTDRGEYDNEGSEVKGDMHTVIRHATELERHLRDQENLPTWVIEKIGQIKGMMTSVSDYILSQHERGVEHASGEEGIRIAEKITKNTPTDDVIHDFVHSKNPKFAGKSKKERINQALGASYAMKKGKMEEADKPDFLDIDKDGDKKESMKKAAKDKQTKEEKVDETTVAGSVATATTSGKSSKGGMQFGKGVYESFNASVEQMITESITVESNMEECGDMGQAPSITVQADGEEAAKLLMLLKLAGLGNELEENKLDWPTDPTVTGGNDPHLQRLSGGLNKPKSTGQSTMVGGGIPNYQARRQISMEESVELERSLFKTWKNYKG